MKKLLITGNGPSISKINYSRLPKDADVFRLNNFFFEEEYYVGKRVDYYLTDIGFIKGQFYNLYNLKVNNEYVIDKIFSTGGKRLVENYPFAEDIFDTVYKNKEFVEFLTYYQIYYGKLVSGGILSLLAAVELGYKDIYLAGFDLYRGNEIYPWQDKANHVEANPRDIKENVLNVINEYHPEYLQLKAIELVKNQSGVKLFSISDESPINEYVELAPLLGVFHDLPTPRAQSAIKDWLKLPEVAEETIMLSESQQAIIEVRTMIADAENDRARLCQDISVMFNKLDELDKRTRYPKWLINFLACFIFKKNNRQYFRQQYSRH